jgi:hypothetical protein
LKVIRFAQTLPPAMDQPSPIAETASGLGD